MGRLQCLLGIQVYRPKLDQLDAGVAVNIFTWTGPGKLALHGCGRLKQALSMDVSWLYLPLPRFGKAISSSTWTLADYTCFTWCGRLELTLPGSELIIAALPRCGQARTDCLEVGWLKLLYLDVGRLELALPGHGLVIAVLPGCGQARTGPTWKWPTVVIAVLPGCGRLELAQPEHGLVIAVLPGCGQAKTDSTRTWASYSCST